MFIDALARMRERTGFAPTAVIVGSGTEKPRYETMVARLGLTGRVVFRDPMPARAAFALARTIVVPSRAESMPYIVLEAIGAGVPDRSPPPSAAFPKFSANDAGQFVAPGDQHALADAMSIVAATPAGAREIVERLRARAEQLFTVEKMAGAVSDIYRAVLR